MSMEYFLESCCTDVEQIRRAQEAGARRIELCEKLAVGGVTPSAELLKAAISVAKVPVNVLVRPVEAISSSAPPRRTLCSGI